MMHNARVRSRVALRPDAQAIASFFFNGRLEQQYEDFSFFNEHLHRLYCEPLNGNAMQSPCQRPLVLTGANAE